jgi:predicted DNA-binding protein
VEKMIKEGKEVKIEEMNNVEVSDSKKKKGDVEEELKKGKEKKVDKNEYWRSKNKVERLRNEKCNEDM